MALIVQGTVMEQKHINFKENTSKSACFIPQKNLCKSKIYNYIAVRHVILNPLTVLVQDI